MEGGELNKSSHIGGSNKQHQDLVVYTTKGLGILDVYN
jgi:hypothetical protein